MVTQTSSDVDEESGVVVDVVHCGVKLATTFNQLGASRYLVITYFAFFLWLIPHEREFSGVEDALVHFLYQFADLRLALHYFKSGLLVTQREVLKFRSCHYRVFSSKFTRCSH